MTGIVYMDLGPCAIRESGINSISLWKMGDSESVLQAEFIGVIPVCQLLKLKNVKDYQKLSNKHLRVYV